MEIIRPKLIIPELILIKKKKIEKQEKHSNIKSVIG